MARKTRLTTEIIDAIAERIRQGTFPYIAAQSVGVARSTFYDWIGRGESGRKPFSELLDKVREASAAARHDAESRVFQEKPLEWLRLGPGRSKPNEPGWTDTKVVAGDPERPIEHHHERLGTLRSLPDRIRVPARRRRLRSRVDGTQDCFGPHPGMPGLCSEATRSPKRPPVDMLTACLRRAKGPPPAAKSSRTETGDKG